MTVNATTSNTEAQTSGDPSSTFRNTSSSLSQADFFALLSVQLQNQDPLNPVDDTQMLAQMAQFSALAQTEELVSQMGYLRADLQMQGASSLIGKEVTVASDGELITGTVEAIAADTDAVYLKIGEYYYNYNAIVEVAQPEPAPAGA
ncbi:flagellar hook capping protein [Opitutaceae bacterium TAV1]|nr:flagellar hook capping protein [Opitutaceae bacterium TAV1]